MSCCPSSGCNHQPCSQSQKMSIGIVVESVAKPRCGSMKEAGVSINHTRKEASDEECLMVKHNVDSGVKAPSTGIVRKHDAQEGSVTFSAGLPTANLMKDSDQVENQTSCPAINFSHGKQPTCIMQSSVNQRLLKPVVGKKTEPDQASGKVSKRASMDETSQKFSCTPKQQVRFPAKEVLLENPNEMENRSKEVLRMKLREALGTAPSGNKILGDSRTCEANANKMMKEQTVKGDAYFIPRQNSDTIETDSENVDMTTKRPVTRTLARRRTCTKTRPRNFKPKSLSSDKVKHPGSDVFSFAEKSGPNFKPKSLSSDKVKHPGSDVFSFAEKSGPSEPCAVNQGFSAVEKNDCTKTSCGIKLGDMLSPIADLRNVHTEIRGCEKEPPVVELPNVGVIFSKHGCLDDNPEPEAEMQDINCNHSPVAREGLHDAEIFKHGCLDDNPEPEAEMQDINCVHSPVVREGLPDAEVSYSQKKALFFETFGDWYSEPHVDDLCCPWFEMTKSALNSPLHKYPLTNDKKLNVHGSAEAGIRFEARCFFKSSTASENDSFESSDDAAKFEVRYSNTPKSSTKEKDVGNGRFTRMGGELDSTEDFSSSKKVYPELDGAHVSPEDRSRFVQRPVLFRSKRHCSHDADSSDFSCTLHTPKVGGNAGDVFPECLDECSEDGLARVVSLLGLALEKVITKMVSVTNEKCSEILVSAVEEIHSQLLNVESQIQRDLVKLTSLKTSKRKHLETRLQEQQEHLKVMHRKFKEEIFQYLQDCKGTMDGLEAQHIELRGVIKRQKALHRKLLLQTEAAVETHLIKAQRQMMFVRKMGKQKMQQLKATIAGSL